MKKNTAKCFELLKLFDGYMGWGVVILCFCVPGKSQGRGSLVGCRLWGRTESDTTEVT